MKIAFLEDNKSFAEDIVGYLSLAGHEVHHFFTGRDCLKALVNEKYDMRLFDWEVPDMSGYEVLTNLKLKGSVTPVIFLTGRDAEEDIVQVMEAGADDYIVKPPSNNILNARINALYRRANPSKAQLEAVNYGHLTVDFANRRFEINQLPVKLTEKETDLALYFFKHLDVLLSRGHLTKVVWGTTPDLDTRTIDVHVSHLRNKLNLLPQFGWRLISVYHQGYRLERLV